MIRRFFLLFTIPILLYTSQENTIISAEQNKLYEKNEWKALLHYDLPSHYKNINEHLQYRFPDRLLFISHELNISIDEFPKVNCQDLNIYKEKSQL